MEEDQEEETDSKFGPVMDHLPFIRTSSVAALSEGSMVDALGAVSEGDSAGEMDSSHPVSWLCAPLAGGEAA